MARSITSLSLLRLVACIAALSLTLVFGMRPAVAGPPSADDGCSGGGTSETDDTGMMIEEVGLVPTNGGPGSFTMAEAPVLVGSGPEREAVATEVVVIDTTESEMIRGDLSPVDTGPEVALVDSATASTEPPEWAMTDNERSIQLIESTFAPGGYLAGWDDIAAAQGPVLVGSGPERDASATEAVATSGEADFAPTTNERSTAMSEDKLTSDGRMAGWDDIAATDTEALASGGSGGRPSVLAS